MDSFRTYELLEPLDYNLGPNITACKAKNREGALITLFSINSSNNPDLSKRLKTRSTLQHPNLVQILDIYEEPSSKTIQMITKHCAKTLADFLEECFRKSMLLREEFICKVLYQILCTVKTVNSFYEDINVNSIFINEEFNVELLNCSLNPPKNKLRMTHVASLVYTMCTLEPFDKRTFNLKQLEAHYSSHFISLVQSILKDKCSLSKTIDKILCNATLLLKCSQWHRDKTFIDRQPEIQSAEHILEQLKVREMALRFKEELLNEKEQELLRREKKVILLEKLAKEKLIQAEEMARNKNRGKENEEVEDCGDSGVVMMRKPQKTFTRSKSERRVKFKGHSPLKEMNFNRRKSVRKSDVFAETETKKTTKKLFETKENAVLFQDGVVEETEEECKYRPISWNQENKRHAFDLLRIMNNVVDKQTALTNTEIKHTFL